MKILEKIIKPKKINITDYPNFIAGELSMRFWVGVISLIVMLVLGIAYRATGFVWLGIIIFAMFVLPSAHSYYALTRDLCFLMEGTCVEIRNTRNAQDFTHKLLYFSKNKVDYVIECQENGQTYVVSEKKKLLGSTLKCKVGERVYVIFMPNASYQNLNGDFVIYPLFSFTQRVMDKIDKDASVK